MKNNLLSTNDLKGLLHQRKLAKKRLTQLDKLLMVLASIGGPCTLADIHTRSLEAGFNIPRSWNLSAILARSQGRAIRTPNGWEITEAGKQHLRKLGVNSLPAAAAQVATDLRAELSNISDPDTYSFVEDAIKCYEFQLYRAAVVMSWLAAVHVLQRHVLNNCLGAFNAEVKRVDAKWKPAVTTDDIGRMKEADFLDRLVAVSVIGKNVKAQLKECLDLRNACGHPSSLNIGANSVAHHLEVLLMNVFRKFQ